MSNTNSLIFYLCTPSGVARVMGKEQHEVDEIISNHKAWTVNAPDYGQYIVLFQQGRTPDTIIFASPDEFSGVAKNMDRMLDYMKYILALDDNDCIPFMVQEEMAR